MLLTRQEIVNEPLSRLGTTSANIDATDLTSIQLRVNQVQDFIFYDRDWEWRKRTYYFTARAPYATGTVSLTQNSRSVTGSGSTWTASMRLGYLVIADKAYKIQSVSNGTTLLLEAPYADTSISGTSYKIVFPDIYLPHEIESIVAVRCEGMELDVVNRDSLTLHLASVATPQQVAFGDRVREDYYNSGTVAVTLGSATVTGTDTAFDSSMEGMSIRINEFSKPYVIKTVVSTTQITLRSAYEGTSGSGKTYAISPVGTNVMTLRHSPDDYYYIEVEALIGSEKLVSDTAYSLIPNHSPLLHGVIWLAFTDLKDMNPVRIQQARADFERTLEQLRSNCSVVSNLRWKSNLSTSIQKSGVSYFNPLDTRTF